MEHHEETAHQSYIALDECIQASLRTLELVRHSHPSGEKREILSEYEIETANVSLNQIIRTAESIKEKLRSNGGTSQKATERDYHLANTAKRKDNEMKTATDNNDGSLLVPPTRQHHNNTDNAVEVASNSESSCSNQAPPTRIRKLSTPCLTPIEPVEITVRFINSFILP